MTPAPFDTQRGGAIYRRITRRYVLALACIAAAVVAGFVMLHILIGNMRDDAALINTAGAQRMLSQRIALLTISLPAVNSDASADLDRAITTMRANHARLTEGDGAPARSTPALTQHYFARPVALDQRVLTFLDAATALHANPTDPAAQAAMSIARMSARWPLLRDLDNAVTQYQAAAASRVGTTEHRNFMITLIAMGVLVGAGLLIFRPLARQLGQQADALDDQVRLMDAVMRVIPVGLALWNPRDRRLLHVNPAFTSLTGLSANALTCMPIDLIVGASGADITLTNGENAPRVGHITSRDVPLQAQPVQVTLIADLTDDRAREAALAQALLAANAASEAKARFTASVSHEIRTPLNGIMGMLDLMMLDRLSVDQSQRLQTARASAEHLMDILNDILDAASLAAGVFDIRPTSVPLRALITTTVAAFEGRAATKGIALSSTIDMTVPDTLLTDPRRLRQILSNLIGNAIKFTSVGAVSLRVLASGDRLEFSVEDTGPGIAPADLDRLFTRFVKLDAPCGNQSGTGLGLAISRELVTALGGEIGVTSTLGHGSTFSFALPVVTSDKTICPLNLGPLRILIADDNRTNRLVARKMLECLGHSVSEAENGREAIDMGRKGGFDMIMMDWEMPVLDGLSATRELVAARAVPRFGIIGLTAHAGAASRDTCLAAGMRAVMTKPIRIHDLQALMAGAVAGETDSTAPVRGRPNSPAMQKRKGGVVGRDGLEPPTFSV